MIESVMFYNKSNWQIYLGSILLMKMCVYICVFLWYVYVCVCVCVCVWWMCV